ncbi:MAG: divalent-cation tolerance protein CutA [Methylococcaceae bacterium]|nr:divalent-cation tolerance protein CutA [Methylococcaceae bacterium]
MTNIQLIFCTCPDQSTAETLAHLLLNEEWAACVNILPSILSLYRWQGQIESAQEHLLLIKATQQNYPNIEQAIKQHHPYGIPEIIAVSVTEGLPAYLRWIESTT